MYGYEWTKEYGIFQLTVSTNVKKEIRPVFHEELDFFGMDKYWDYPKDTDAPLLWAEGIRQYVLNGEVIAKAIGGSFYSKPEITLMTEERLKLRPIDIDRLYEVNHDFMMALEQKAIQFIQEQYKIYSAKGHAFVCAFSGGKDSLVLLDLVSKALSPDKFYVVFSNTGMELSDTLKAVERAKEHWLDLRFEEARCHMEPEESWEKIGPPASKLRWCCSVHKSVPTILLIKELVGNKKNIVVFDGVRAEESARRAKYSEVGEGVKNIQQINCHAILKWSSSEVFMYLFKNKILLNDAYKMGIYRVGCKICPMSAKWQDSLIANNYPKEIKNALAALEKVTINAKGKLDKKYIEDGGWQARAGGKILGLSKNRVREVASLNDITFYIENTQQNWQDVIPIIGNVVETKGKTLIVKTKYGNLNCKINQTDEEAVINITPTTILDRYGFSTLRSIANKTAYCVGCKACVPQCPTGAFDIANNKIVIRENLCIHCSACCNYTNMGCIVSKSLHIRSGNMKNPDRYRNFGFRQAFYLHFLDSGVDCFEQTALGKDQYKALKQWLGEAGVLVMETKETSGRKTESIKNKLTPLAEKLIKFGGYNPFSWAIMWTNLAFNSPVVQTFCLNVEGGQEFDKDIVIEALGNEYSEKANKQATNSLLSTFRDSPIGSSLKQGIQLDKNYYREGWTAPHAVALLYSLYLYGERTGRKSFTFTELINSHKDPNAKGVSPHDIFGIDPKDFKDHVQGLALTFPEYIRVSFVANLDNIILQDYSSNDIIDLATED